MCIKDFMKFIQDTINVSWMVMYSDATGNVTGITEDIEVDDLCIMTP